jgi:hypothetical protein
MKPESRRLDPPGPVCSAKLRRRSYSMAAVIITIAIGLLSRSHLSIFPAVLGKYPGDLFWAETVYWTLCFVFPSASVTRIAFCAVAVSYVDEIGQLYHTPWIDQIRATAVGHLVLGTAFSWADMLSYTIGVGLCIFTERLLIRFGSRL